MKKRTLLNGVTIIEEKTSSPTVTIQGNVAIGSGHETTTTRGYAHFLEHMVFEGTTTRTNFDIANEVERVGGELNGATNQERTKYYIKVPKKYAQKALDIIIDILVNPSLEKPIFDKEKQVILSEIDMYHDDPKLYQWLLLEQVLFSSDLRYSTLGSRASIGNASLSRLQNFYKKHYVGGNITLSVAGDVPSLNYDVLKKVKKGTTKKTFKEPRLQKNKRIKKKLPTSQSYFLRGFKTCPRGHEDSIVLDVLHAHLARGASGVLFDELRNKRGVGYSVFAIHEPGKASGIFAIAVSTKKKHLSMVEEVVEDILEAAKAITPQQLQEAITYVCGHAMMQSEDTKNEADDLAVWHQYASLKDYKVYLSRVKKVTEKDVKRVIQKYFKYHATITLEE